MLEKGIDQMPCGMVDFSSPTAGIRVQQPRDAQGHSVATSTVLQREAEHCRAITIMKVWLIWLIVIINYIIK